MNHSVNTCPKPVTIANRLLYKAMLEHHLDDWLAQAPLQLKQALHKSYNGNIPKWKAAVNRLPLIKNPMTAQLNQAIVSVEASLTDSETKQIDSLLKQLLPWRKGPFQIGSGDNAIFIDTEWRSDLKWDRLVNYIAPLDGRCVLDVGGGSGYHAYRMSGAGAAFVLNIDPSPLFYYQFLAIRYFLSQANQSRSVSLPHFLPIGVESVPLNGDRDGKDYFDTVFSMGVLYHRPDVFGFLQQLKQCLKPGGELVLETLVISGDTQSVFVPPGRYGCMANVYFIPSSQALCCWLEKTGFKNIRIVDETVTGTSEQRRTSWMSFHSLAEFLDPDDRSKTAEGHPAPKRAIIIANKP